MDVLAKGLEQNTMDDNIIQSIERATRILEIFSNSKPRLGISEISRALNLHKGTVQGLVRTLAQLGYLRQDAETRKYQLGLKIYELGAILTANLEINQKASFPAHSLALQTKRMVRIGILDKYSALVIMDVYPRSQPYIFPYSSPLRAPLYCTAMGKALLAFLEEREIDGYFKETKLIPYTSNTTIQKEELLKELKVTRERGYAINREEHFLGRAAIAAPIFDRKGNPSTSISVVIDPEQINEEQMNKKISKEVMRTAFEISRLMGFENK